MVSRRGGLPRLPGVAALAGGVPLPALPEPRWLAAGSRAVGVLAVWASGDGPGAPHERFQAAARQAGQEPVQQFGDGLDGERPRAGARGNAVAETMATPVAREAKSIRAKGITLTAVPRDRIGFRRSHYAGGRPALSCRVCYPYVLPKVRRETRWMRAHGLPPRDR